MATKQQWEEYIQARKEWQALYEHETKLLEKAVKEMPEDGEMKTASAGIETPPPPKNP